MKRQTDRVTCRGKRIYLRTWQLGGCNGRRDFKARGCQRAPWRSRRVISTKAGTRENDRRQCAISQIYNAHVKRRDTERKNQRCDKADETRKIAIRCISRAALENSRDHGARAREEETGKENEEEMDQNGLTVTATYRVCSFSLRWDLHQKTHIGTVIRRVRLASG